MKTEGAQVHETLKAVTVTSEKGLAHLASPTGAQRRSGQEAPGLVWKRLICLSWSFHLRGRHLPSACVGACWVAPGDGLAGAIFALPLSFSSWQKAHHFFFLYLDFLPPTLLFLGFLILPFFFLSGRCYLYALPLLHSREQTLSSFF